jgi:hypothetical protein
MFQDLLGEKPVPTAPTSARPQFPPIEIARTDLEEAARQRELGQKPASKSLIPNMSEAELQTFLASEAAQRAITEADQRVGGETPLAVRRRMIRMRRPEAVAQTTADESPEDKARKLEAARTAYGANYDASYGAHNAAANPDESSEQRTERLDAEKAKREAIEAVIGGMKKRVAADAKPDTEVAK